MTFVCMFQPEKKNSKKHNLKDFMIAQCPEGAPFPAYKGQYCCVHETVDAKSGCDPLNEEDFVPCPSPPCKTKKEKVMMERQVHCPGDFPFSHHRGQYCCKTGNVSSDCLVGELNDNAPWQCCAGGNFVPCPGRDCQSRKHYSFRP